MTYPSDVNDTEWAILEPYFLRNGMPGRPQKYPIRVIVNACLYVLKTGCQWRMLPNDFPPWDSVYWHFRRWRKRGLWQVILRDLHKLARKLEGRNPEPSAGIVDAQSVKSSRKKGF